jgi:hypothetical protein
MTGWENFFVGELGASSALAGLVFVGISINLTKILASPHLPNRALEALVALLAVLFASTLLLVPGQPFLAYGIEVLIIGLIYCMILVVLQVNILRRMKPQYRLSFSRIVIVSQSATLLFMIAGITLLVWGKNGLYWIVPATIISFMVAFYDAWVLLIEINR